jgi:hypothetical protein
MDEARSDRATTTNVDIKIDSIELRIRREHRHSSIYDKPIEHE